jgi:hypothetical protein
MGSQATIHQLHEGQQAMPSKNGYVNLWRDINDQPWSSDELIYGVFVKLMTTVQHKPYNAEFKGVTINLKAGERAVDYTQIVEMFNGVKDKEHAKRIIKKFKSLSQIYTKPLKDKGVHIGFIIGFFGWEKWQNRTTPLTTPQTTPNTTDLKAYRDGKTTPQATPRTTHINNNDLNNKKDKRVSHEQAQDALTLKPVSQEKPKAKSREQQVVDLYNDILANKKNNHSLPCVKVLTDKRKRTIAKLLNLADKDIAKVRRYFEWLMSNADSHKWIFGDNNRGWVADIEFVCRDETFAKATENRLNDWETSK